MFTRLGWNKDIIFGIYLAVIYPDKQRKEKWFVTERYYLFSKLHAETFEEA